MRAFASACLVVLALALGAAAGVDATEQTWLKTLDFQRDCGAVPDKETGPIAAHNARKLVECLDKAESTFFGNSRVMVKAGERFYLTNTSVVGLDSRTLWIDGELMMRNYAEPRIGTLAFHNCPILTLGGDGMIDGMITYDNGTKHETLALAGAAVKAPVLATKDKDTAAARAAGPRTKRKVWTGLSFDLDCGAIQDLDSWEVANYNALKLAECLKQINGGKGGIYVSHRFHLTNTTVVGMHDTELYIQKGGELVVKYFGDWRDPAMATIGTLALHNSSPILIGAYGGTIDGIITYNRNE